MVMRNWVGWFICVALGAYSAATGKDSALWYAASLVIIALSKSPDKENPNV